MVTAQTSVPTERAGRYLVQLCEHLQLIATGRIGAGGHHQPGKHPDGLPDVRHVEWTAQRGTVAFADGQVSFDATSQALSIRVEAPTAEALERIKTLVAQRIRTIGRRDQVTVSW